MGHVKLYLDFIIALVCITALSPVFILIIFLLLLQKQSPFFFQRRAGRHGRIFRVIKFKTMNDKKDADGKLLPDHERKTWIGNFLRKTSLDEIPQLINVLKGDMSLVGPRPLLVDYLRLYNEEQRRRHEVKPGITGWAQVKGRNAIGWEKKFELDVWYVDNVSFALDLKIILLTVKKVLISEGITPSNKTMMPFFQGTKKS